MYKIVLFISVLLLSCNNSNKKNHPTINVNKTKKEPYKNINIIKHDSTTYEVVHDFYTDYGLVSILLELDTLFIKKYGYNASKVISNIIYNQKKHVGFPLVEKTTHKTNNIELLFYFNLKDSILFTKYFKGKLNSIISYNYSKKETNALKSILPIYNKKSNYAIQNIFYDLIKTSDIKVFTNIGNKNIRNIILENIYTVKNYFLKYKFNTINNSTNNTKIVHSKSKNSKLNYIFSLENMNLKKNISTRMLLIKLFSKNGELDSYLEDKISENVELKYSFYSSKSKHKINLEVKTDMNKSVEVYYYINKYLNYITTNNINDINLKYFKKKLSLEIEKNLISKKDIVSELNNSALYHNSNILYKEIEKIKKEDINKTIKGFNNIEFKTLYIDTTMFGKSIKNF